MNGAAGHATVLWRDARWRCECSRDVSEWALRLLCDQLVVSECAVDTIDAMLGIANQWREAVGTGRSDDLSSALRSLLPQSDAHPGSV